MRRRANNRVIQSTRRPLLSFEEMSSGNLFVAQSIARPPLKHFHPLLSHFCRQLCICRMEQVDSRRRKKVKRNAIATKNVCQNVADLMNVLQGRRQVVERPNELPGSGIVSHSLSRKHSKQRRGIKATGIDRMQSHDDLPTEKIVQRRSTEF
uniref:DAD domain-containing protein n=1 Tax=Trichuris muris TaxID=70415 RepID=A0A5S6QFR0_TRIMR